MGREVVAAGDPIEIAARSLRHADRSRREIDERLARAGIDAGARTEAIEELERIGYLDDDRVAAVRAGALARRGYGDTAIRAELVGRGLQPEAVAAALTAIAPEVERAVELAARLGRSPKTGARLARKGFARESVEAALGGEFSGSDA